MVNEMYLDDSDQTSDTDPFIRQKNEDRPQEGVSRSSFKVVKKITLKSSLKYGIPALLITILSFGIFLLLVLTGEQKTNFGDNNLPKSGFSGAFSRFPKVSELPQRQKRLTVIAQWVHDDDKPLLRSFLNSVQENADTIDLLLINRLIDPGRSCIDFEKAGINVTWGGNIKHVCLRQEEWENRLVKFLCNERYGWACSSIQEQEVAAEVKKRPDRRGYEWKPFRGPMYHDLFVHPENPFWAWVDVDTVLGDLRHFPFSLLSNLSFVVLDHGSVAEAVLYGQMTAWNMEDKTLLSCWKDIPTLRTPEHLTRALEGPHLQSGEEQEWSYRYLNVEEGFPGAQLSFAQLADAQADDYFIDGLSVNRQDGQKDVQYIFSGRDVLFTHRILDRKAIEDLIYMERDSNIDDNGWFKWTTGYDGSDLMLLNPSLTQAQAYIQNKGPYSSRMKSNHFRGQLETIQYHKGEKCPWGDFIAEKWRICYPHHSMTDFKMKGPILRSSFIHFKDQEAGFLFQRREIDNSIRGYARYLLKHSLASKNRPWGIMPPFDLTKDHVLTMSDGLTEVWKLGDDREKTIYRRKEKDETESIG